MPFGAILGSNLWLHPKAHRTQFLKVHLENFPPCCGTATWNSLSFFKRGSCPLGAWNQHTVGCYVSVPLHFHRMRSLKNKKTNSRSLSSFCQQASKFFRSLGVNISLRKWSHCYVSIVSFTNNHWNTRKQRFLLPHTCEQAARRSRWLACSSLRTASAPQTTWAPG